MRVLQINVSVNSGSTGRIAEDIGKVLLRHGHESYIAYGREGRESQSEVIRVGSTRDVRLHGVKSRILDRHGFGSKMPTKDLVAQIEQIKPDVIHLHNIHGYYLHVGVLFEYLSGKDIPLVWTFHDCWPITGHCAYFDRVDCQRWKTGCYSCPLRSAYPNSLFLDNSRKNYRDKKSLFSAVDKMTLVAPCQWMGNILGQSFLQDYPVQVIHNGINMDVFRPMDVEAVREKYQLEGKKVILGVANIWDWRKGLADFVAISSSLPEDHQIVLVGLSSKQIKELPPSILGVSRTESLEELVSFYSLAEVFVNPTYIDNFPTTNIEALACGTPVITYRTGGSPEAVNQDTGLVIERGDKEALLSAILQLTKNGKQHFFSSCRDRALAYFDKSKNFNQYLSLYEKLTEA